MAGICIRPARTSDRDTLARLRYGLWPDSSIEEHAQELLRMFDGKSSGTLPSIILVAEESDGAVIGFLEVGLRSHADGCDPVHAVGFLEGWYVAEDRRRAGIGRKLLAAAEEWAKSLGCVEMASDTWIDHEVSQRAHEALGYAVIDRCVHYRKIL